MFASSPRLIAGFHVFHSLLTPRHPPHTLTSLITPTTDRPARIFLGLRLVQLSLLAGAGCLPTVPRLTARRPSSFHGSTRERLRARSSVALASVCTFIRATKPGVSTCQRSWPASGFRLLQASAQRGSRFPDFRPLRAFRPGLRDSSWVANDTRPSRSVKSPRFVAQTSGHPPPSGDLPPASPRGSPGHRFRNH